MKFIFWLPVIALTLVFSLSLIQSPQQPLTPEALHGDYDFYNQKAIFHGQDFLTMNIPAPKTAASKVLGTNNSNKRIEVDLTNQRLYGFEGDRKVFDYLISSGKWGRTPTGSFNIWIKLRYTKMEGGNKAINTYYYLPNVPYTMFFANTEVPRSRGFGIHGTYWHSNFGHPMSHGCINMKTEEAEQVFYWAQPDLQGKSMIQVSDDNPGTPVIIYGQAPAE